MSFTASSRLMPLALSECQVENASAWRNAPVRSSVRAPRSTQELPRIAAILAWASVFSLELPEL